MSNKIGESVKPSNYDKSLENLNELIDPKLPGAKILHMWQVKMADQSDSGRAYFFGNPPIVGPIQSDRIMLVGTNGDLRAFDEDKVDDTKYCYCGRIISFWEKFFDSENHLNEGDNLTIPRFIISTGCMRNYSYAGGETMGVRERLMEIADNWGIPFILVKDLANETVAAVIAQFEQK